MNQPLYKFLAGYSVAGALWWILAVLLACLLYPSYNPLVQASSELTARSAPIAAVAIMNSAQIVFGLALIALAFSLIRILTNSLWLKAGSILLVGFGLVSIAGFFFPMNASTDPNSLLETMHGLVYALGIVVVPSLVLLFGAFSQDSKFRRYRWYTLLTPFLMLALNSSGLIPGGLADFMGASVICLWAALVGFWIIRMLQ